MFAAVLRRDENADLPNAGRKLHDWLAFCEQAASVQPATETLRRDLAARTGTLSARTAELVHISLPKPSSSEPVVLTVDKDLDSLPLELADNLALTRPVARRYADIPFDPAMHRSAKHSGGRGRVILVHTRSPRPALRGIGVEVAYLTEKLGKFMTLETWTAPDGRYSDVLNAFYDATEGSDILHFCGHLGIHGGNACFQLDGSREYWLNPAEMYTRAEPPELAVTNTCGRGENMGLAHACLKGGVRAFVQPAVPLADSAALELAASLYSLLRDGMNIGDAIFEIRKRLHARPSLLWAALRLYGTPFWSLQP